MCACNGMTINSHQRASVLIVIERVPFGGIGGVCVTNDVLLFGFTYSGDFTFPFATGWNRRRSRRGGRRSVTVGGRCPDGFGGSGSRQRRW